jgi:general L-amino acid transport system permease protein
MALWLLSVTPIIMFALIYGVGGPLAFTDTRLWGGLMLTIMLTVVGIIVSFPIGVLLALGRRSHLPVISAACTIYIEFVRGVPLITVLFMAQLLVPLVNPTLAEFPNVFRALIGIILFSAAYLAENVRGGLQAIPPGQEEAAKALGMPGWQVTLFITLPQALRAVIPALVGQFISLFKDTSLVAIVGLIDLTGIAEAVVAQTEFLGLRREAYLFAALLYFVFSYAMGYISRRLEATGVGAARRV